MGAGDDTPGHNDRPVVQLHPGGPAAADIHPAHGRAGADLGPGRPRGTGQCLAHPAHTAMHPSPGAVMPVHPADPVVHQHIRRAGAHRPAPGADDGLRRKRALHPVILEPLIQEIRGRHREQPDRLGYVPPGPPPRSRPPTAAHFGRSASDEVRRHHEQQVLQQVRHPVEIPVKLQVRSASAVENFAISAASRAVSPHSVSPDPSGNGTK